MLVIHPADSTTSVLASLYRNDVAATVLTQATAAAEVKRRLHHLPVSERLMLLGHGSDCGLFSRMAEGGEFDRIIVGHPHSFYLRGRCNIIAIWCNADAFARKEGLHGLYSGMIISEMEEADQYGVKTTKEELDRELQTFVDRLGAYISSGTPLHKIPECMRTAPYRPCPLNDFNYQNLYYL